MYAAAGRLAYGPVSDWLRSQAFKTGLARLDPIWLTEVARIIPELHIEQPDLPVPAPLTDSWQRRRLYEALARAILAGERPVVLLLDDMQWCDQETLEWLGYFLRFNSKAKVLLMGTVRAEEMEADQPLASFLLNVRRSQLVTEIELAPLNEADTTSLIAYVAREDLDSNIAAYLYRETEGNPLFIVEMARSQLQIDVGANGLGLPEQWLPLPQLIQTVIESRLNQLSSSVRLGQPCGSHRSKIHFPRTGARQQRRTGQLGP